MKRSNEAVRIITSSTESIGSKADIVNEVESSPGSFTPWALLYVGLYQLERNHFDNAALFLRAAVFRLLVDLKASKDPSLNYVAELAFDHIRDVVSEYVNTPEKHKAWTKALVKADQELESWDRRVPRDYDERWIDLHKLGSSKTSPRAKLGKEEKQAIIEAMYRTFRENAPIN